MIKPTQGSEFDIINQHFKPLAAGHAGALNLSDDAAVLDIPRGFQVLVTTDAIVAGVHFLDSLSPQDIAHKVVGVNLSDLAAMGATPHAVFLAVQFPKGIQDAWIADFAEGLAQALAPSGAGLMGGDTVTTPGPLTLTLTALGLAPTHKFLTRAGANAGDDVYVSGTIGDGALGLLCLTGELEPDEHLIQRYARPQPRWALGQALVERGLASACIDISDGLVADLGHLCAASGLKANITAAKIPLSKAARSCVELDKNLLSIVFTGGDDYELVFTSAPENALALRTLSHELKVPLSHIGCAQKGGPGVLVLDAKGQALDLGPGGYRHF